MRVEAPNTSCFGAKSDDFDGTALDRTRWTRSSGRTRRTPSRGGSLVLPTAAGDLYGSRNDATNLVLQPAPSGAWQATTKVTLPVTANYQQAGLIVYGDDDNYAKVDLLYSGSPPGRVHPGDRRHAAQRRRRQRSTAPPATHLVRLPATAPT